MADQIVTPQELASFLQLTYANLSAVQQTTMTMLAELATGRVQSAAGQLLVAGVDTILLHVDICDFSEWLPLPQLPARSVSSVLIDGVADTSWLLRDQQLWRLAGWNINASAPTEITVTYARGYLAGSQSLQLARGMAFGLGAAGWGNPGGATSEAIDDYRVTYAEADARMQVTDSMADQLRDAYGVTAHVTGSR